MQRQRIESKVARAIEDKVTWRSERNTSRCTCEQGKSRRAASSAAKRSHARLVAFKLSVTTRDGDARRVVLRVEQPQATKSTPEEQRMKAQQFQASTHLQASRHGRNSRRAHSASVALTLNVICEKTNSSSLNSLISEQVLALGSDIHHTAHMLEAILRGQQ